MRNWFQAALVFALGGFPGLALSQGQIHGFDPEESQQGQPVSVLVELYFCNESAYRDADGQPLHDFVIEDNVINLDVKMGIQGPIVTCPPSPPPELVLMPDIPTGNYIFRFNQVEFEVDFPATDADRELRDEVEFIQGEPIAVSVDFLDSWANLLLIMMILGLTSPVLWVKRA